MKRDQYPTRHDYQRSVEKALTDLRPDAIEATELLDGLWAGVMERYGADEVVDLSKEFQDLREALLEFDRTYKPEETDWQHG